MTAQYTPPKRGLKSLTKAALLGTIGRIPLVGKLSRKLWRRARMWWHMPHRQESVLSNLNETSHKVDDRIDRLALQLQTVQEYLSAHISWVRESVDHLDRTTQDRLTTISHELARDVSTMCADYRNSLDHALIRVADNVAVVEAEIVRLHDHHASSYNRLANVNQSILGLIERIQTSATEVVQGHRSYADWLKGLTTSHDGMKRWLELMSQELRGNTMQLGATASGMNGTNAWLSVLCRKLEMVALDIRERVPVVPETGTYITPYIIDNDVMNARIASMNGKVRLNLGSGEKPLPNYINCDGRPLPDTHVVADIRALPFEAGTVDEISSEHLVEHFRQHHLETVILPYWKTLLRSGGIIRVICPNWEEMLEQLNDGRMSLDSFKHVTFGGQDYVGDDHFSMYTPKTFIELLTRVGFTSPNVVVAGRMNGLCPEMEITAVV